jgi:putative transposase
MGQLSLARQCQLLGLPRSSFYYTPVTETPENLALMRMIDKEHMDHPFLGVRGMTLWLNRTTGGDCNPKRVRRLMRKMGIEAIYPKPRTSMPGLGHTIFPYLLRSVDICKPNQVWCSDITYIPLEKGYMYLVAVMDWFSRRALAWRLSNTLTTDFCIEALDASLAAFGAPEIFNTDQGSQFTSAAFQDRLTSQNIRISMDGRRRALDNVMIERLWRSVKYEDVYLKCYTGGQALFKGLARYFDYYNHRRSHQGLAGQTPVEAYNANP